MIDKKRVGKYLKKLRKEKNYTQEKLAYEVLNISINAIAEWESGNTIPSIDKLDILANLYDKSIDEILDGEDSCDVDYKKKYFICDDKWEMEYVNDKNADLYLMRNEQIKLIVKRFKELIMTRIDRELTSNEEKEFKFLFDNFYYLSDYYSEYSNLEINDDYLLFKDSINGLLAQNRNMTKKEIYWEMQKLYKESRKISFSFREDVSDLKDIPILQERFKEIEDWQKDMLLDMFQKIEPYNEEPGRFGSKHLKRYEETHGKYDHDQLVKNEIKELIKRGAYINNIFFNVKRVYNENKRLIDRVEELYNLCIKPIEMYYKDENDENKTLLIENNTKNRFLNNYYFTLRFSLKGIGNHDYGDINELYDWFINNDEISDDIYYEIAKRNKVNISQEKEYWLIDAKNSCTLESDFKKFKAKELEIKNGLVELEKLKVKLYSGEKEYVEQEEEEIGGQDEKSIRDYVERLIFDLDYSVYLKGRDKKKTEELYKDLDVLSLDEIKNKYFGMEVLKDE